MNVLFLSMMCMTSLDESNIYSDLLKEFILHGHHVDILCPIEKRYDFSDSTVSGDGYQIFYVHTGNVTNTGFVEKGVSVLKIGEQINACIDRNIGQKQIDLFLVAVPPVTFETVIHHVKKTYRSRVYLLLKDIWPASMFDLKVPGGIVAKTIVSAVFRHWEKRLYKEVDKIGCLSPGNVKYVLEHNRYLDAQKVEVNPNCITPREIPALSEEQRCSIRAKYGIPEDQVCFIYGGTLGVGQNVAHIVKCLRACKDLDCHFVISGKGVQYHLLEEYLENEKPHNLTLINGLPKLEYEKLMQACDVGLVFLRYTAQTPNIPSRILSYMEYGLPILTCLDPVSDLTQIVEEGGFGWGCLSNDEMMFQEAVLDAINADRIKCGKHGRDYVCREYMAVKSYKMIVTILRE